MTTIEQQIIPRLLVAHAAGAVPLDVCPDARLPPTVDEVLDFAALAARDDVAGILESIEAMMRAGLTMETVLLDALGPAARALGEQWLEDERSFAEVTLGLGALQRVVAVLGRGVETPLSHRGLIVLMAAPGEQHTLAILILGELLRQAGWAAHVDPALDTDELVDFVASEPVVMVGLTVKDPAHVEPLGPVVADVKRYSANPDIIVMLGGAEELVDHAPRLGAIYCPSARAALAWLSRHARVHP
ncbi:MAG: B12-binding domain-containing protein [Sandaracinaceae bacterium]